MVKRLVWPILTIFLVRNQLSPTEIGIVFAVGVLIGLILEVPSGAIADRIGRKTCLIISMLGCAASMFLFWLSHGFWGFLIANALYWAAGSLWTGTHNALIYETLKELNTEPPNEEKIAKAIAAREQVRILPTGSTALNQLGLSTQIPMNAVYLTDGARRTIHIGKGTIIFKPTTPKKFAYKGKYSGLLIRALEDINLKDIESDMYRRIRKLVQKEDNELLEHDLKLAPAKIHDYLFSIIKELIFSALFTASLRMSFSKGVVR